MSAWPLAMEWSGDGHLTELALSTLADGQAEVISDEGAAHLQGCEVCQGRFADAIVEHVAVGRAMESLPVEVEERAKVPWGWMMLSASALVAVRAPTIAAALADGSWVREFQRAMRVASLVGWSLCVERTVLAGVVSVGLAALVVAALATWTAPHPEKI